VMAIANLRKPPRRLETDFVPLDSMCFVLGGAEQDGMQARGQG